jgi:hypothetical protein
MYEHVFLKAGDLNGKDYTFTIAKVQKEVAKTRQGNELAVSIYFEELKEKIVKLPDAVTGAPTDTIQPQKKLWCNKTNGRTIADLHGSDVNGWVGKRVTIYPTTTRGAAGKTVDCIRVRPVAPQLQDNAPPDAPSEPHDTPPDDLGYGTP